MTRKERMTATSALRDLFPTIVVGASLALGAAGCLCTSFSVRCPAVTSFKASRYTTCPGDPVELSWTATGTTRLLSVPSAACAGPVEPEGHRACSVQQDTLFTLDARQGGGVLREQQIIEVIPNDGRKIAIGGRTECRGDHVVAVALLSSADWGPPIRVTRVAIATARPISIRHEGRTLTLDPVVPSSDAFSGTSVAGQWILDTPILATETCEAASRAPDKARPPDALGVTVLVQCGP
jgi:hypothetical protein